MIECKNLSHIYNQGNAFEKVALKDINLKIGLNEFIGIIGHTGSGKSTLVQHLNALMLPSSGDVLVDGINTKEKGSQRHQIRQKVGLVFQYPEYQLFEETVYLDIAFGPKNLGFSKEEVDQKVRQAMDWVGLDFQKYAESSPFELSGGQKRRVAIAGVVAMEPDVLVLDEPTAGLDPQGREEILKEISHMFERRDMTIILVSHSMEDIARLATRLLVIDHGEIVLDDTPKKVFSQRELLDSIGLSTPLITQFAHEFHSLGHDIPTDLLTVEEAFEVMKDYLRGQKHV